MLRLTMNSVGPVFHGPSAFSPEAAVALVAGADPGRVQPSWRANSLPPATIVVAREVERDAVSWSFRDLIGLRSYPLDPLIER